MDKIPTVRPDLDSYCHAWHEARQATLDAICSGKREDVSLLLRRERELQIAWIRELNAALASLVTAQWLALSSLAPHSRAEGKEGNETEPSEDQPK